MKSTSDIALLFFARSPYGDTKRRAFASNRLHMEVISHLHFQTYKKLRDTGLPVILSNEHTQKSHSLAVNLSRAILEIFQKGFQKVIVVGNDCPDLNSSTLENAIQSLREGKNVLGPDMVGGNYLIGIDKSEFCESAFENALSEKSKVHNKLSALLQNVDETLIILERKHDINSLNSLLEYIKSTVKFRLSITLVRKVCFLLSHFTKVYPDYILRYCPPNFSSGYSLRGPPCVF